MLKKIFILLFFLMLVVLQTSLFPRFFPNQSFPSIALIVVIFWSAHAGFDKTWQLAALGGFLTDVFYFFPIGANILSFSVAAFIASFLAKRFLVTQTAWKFLVFAIISSIGIFFNEIAGVLLAHIKIGVIFPDTSSIIFWKSFYGLILGFVLYWPIKKIGNLSFFIQKK